MKRPRQHVMEDASEALFRKLLPPEWIVRRIVKDYGIDFEVELVDQDVVSGDRIWVQLRSIQKGRRAIMRYPVASRFPDLPSDGKGNICAEYFPNRVEKKLIDYALRCHFPLLLIVVDFEVGDAFWVPIRDHIMVNLSNKDRPRKGYKSTTFQIPTWNSLIRERERNFPGLRWYSIEPARMYAFAVLHHFHHDFQQNGRLSDYSIGDGWIDGGEREELMRSLTLAKDHCTSALELDVLFGSKGIDYFSLNEIPGLGASGISLQIASGIVAAKKALKLLKSGSYKAYDLAILLGYVHQAISLMSTAISSYQGFRGRFLLTEASTVWRLGTAQGENAGGAPILPLAWQPHWPD